MADVHMSKEDAEAGALVSFAMEQAFQPWDSLFDSLPIGIYTCDLEGIVLRYNRRAAELWGVTPELSGSFARYSGAHRTYRIDGTPLMVHASPMREVLQTGQPIRNREMIVERPDGSRVAILANIEPLFDAEGQLIGGVNCFQEIAASTKADDDGRHNREQQFHKLLEVLPTAVYTTDAEGRITFYNQAAADLWGSCPEHGADQGGGPWRLYWPDGRPVAQEECPMALVLKGQSFRGREIVAERPDGTRIPFLAYPSALRDESGMVIGAVTMMVDISDRKQAEMHQRSLIDELNHRVKNTLATVQALATQTFRKTEVPQDVREQFEARVYALSRAHDHLSMTLWKSADLGLMLDDIFAPHLEDGDDRVHIQGEAVKLTPQAALTLAMALNELGTNAVKYGSLSSPEGRIDLTWSVSGEDDERRLNLQWLESGGPAVTPPEHVGFGTRFVERSITLQLGGRLVMAFEPTGLRCEMEIPLVQKRGDGVRKD